jgi:hypothetical protein
LKCTEPATGLEKGYLCKIFGMTDTGPNRYTLFFLCLSPCPHELKSGMRFVGLGLGRYAVWKRWLAGILEMAVEKS